MLISDTSDTGSDLDVICNRNLRARDTSKWEVPSLVSLKHLTIANSKHLSIAFIADWLGNWGAGKGKGHEAIR